MPGREELIQQNIAKARVASQAPKPEESKGKAPLSSGLSTGGGGPRSFFGGNLEVYSALDKVEFQGVLGDNSMRGNTAYIRLWKRAGSVQQTADVGSVASIPDSAWAELTKDFWKVQSGLSSAVYTGPDLGFDTVLDPATFTNIYTNGDLALSSEYKFVSNAPFFERQEGLATQTPTSSQSATRTNTVEVVGQSSQPPDISSATGAVKSANPNGFWNNAGKAGKALLGIPQGKPNYTGEAMGGDGTAPVSGEMMWQFLFNPSELELELGPEFKNAETWGVSDKGNSGQPLHWSHNKNAVLKFNSVLLNGFIFGRKVEALEQGLIELFMARDGAGQHGPHILEFVWGKRVFGPCVIKNVNIKEKMWDEGEVVNAEVSFTLEQIPEWTINDGFVDVARPGRLIVQGDPTITSNPASKVAGVATESNKNPNPGVGKKSDPKSKDQNRSPITALYSKCQRAGVFADKFAKIEKNSAPNYAATTGSVVRQRSLYNQLYPQAVNELGLDFTKRISNPMANPTNLYKSTELAIEQENNKGPFDLTRNYARAMGYVQGVANSGRIAASSFSKSAQCVEERKKVDAETKAQKQVKQCQGKRLGSECSNSGAYVTTCSGIRLICSRGFLRDPSRASIRG